MTGKMITKGIAKDIVIVVIGVLIIWLGLRVVFGTENPFYVVSSGSMVPELQVFDVLVVQGNESFENVQKGDIIVFHRPAGHDRVIVHRVAEVIDDDPKTIRTKGDANPSSIPGTDFPITDEEYIGKVAYVIPQIGYITRILMPPVNYIIIAVIVGIMIFKQISKNKKAKEVSLSAKADATNETFQNSALDVDLTNIPKDDEYTDLEKIQNSDIVNQTKSDSKENTGN
ncbi:MAG: signal peptidase I [Nitrososphaerota archaeon]